MKPLIGIPCYQDITSTPNRPRYMMYQSYVKALEAANAAPVLLPLEMDSLETFFDRMDGILLAGGDDVNPIRYGNLPHPKTEIPDAQRDDMEIALAHMAMKTGKPLLAICRGLQVLNVAAGGTLIQHLPDELGTIRHDYNDNDLVANLNAVQTVEINPDSQLASMLGVTRTEINSFHHQAIDRLADGFRVVAQTSDGVIEAIELKHPAGQFVIAVQWHPEDMFDTSQPMLRLFESFAKTTQTYALHVAQANLR